MNKSEKVIDGLITSPSPNYKHQMYLSVTPQLEAAEEITIVAKLKRMVRKLKNENMAYANELDALHKDIQSTKLEEMQVEVDWFTKECQRLRKQLEKVIKDSKFKTQKLNQNFLQIWKF